MHVPWLGIEWLTSWSRGQWMLNHWAIPTGLKLFWINVLSNWKLQRFVNFCMQEGLWNVMTRLDLYISFVLNFYFIIHMPPQIIMIMYISSSYLVQGMVPIWLIQDMHLCQSRSWVYLSGGRTWVFRHCGGKVHRGS